MSDPSDTDGPLGRALASAGVDGALVVVLAPAGVGKTMLLVHAALDALDAGERVLHVALADTVDHVRRHHDAALAGRSGVDPARRMIHSDRACDAQRLRAHLDVLAKAASFRPDLVVVDGLDGAPDAVSAELTALASVARDAGARLWASAREEGTRTPDGAVVLTLSPEGSGVAVRLRGPHGERSLELSLGADGSLGPARTGAGARRLTAADVTLYAGGAAGAEAAFGELAEQWGLAEVNFTFPGHVQARTRNASELSERELKAGDVSLSYVSRRLGRTYSTEGTLIRRVLQTLWHMVSRSQKVLVVGAIQADGTVVGGTGWSVELARMWNKDLWVYDQDRRGWFTWTGEAWAPGECVIDAARIAGTGTRYLEPHGRAALEALFQRSF